MKVEGVDPVSGKKITEEASRLTADDVAEINRSGISEENLKSTIDGLNISADAKSVLYEISKSTVKAGKFILKIGRKILDIVVSLFRSYPEAGFGLILGSILGFLIGAIPIVGFILGPVVGPLFAAFGLILGFQQDISNKALAREIAKANRSFGNLAG
ncbi:MAG: hypothetical protein HWE39_07920 [Oceanospirillaceae bacterium]|nr:hypothetical protein [Oceanospirillaceae bacterium]